MQRDLLDFLKMHDVEYKENLILADISPVKIGGEAEIVAYPDSLDKLINLVRFLWKTKIRYKIVGRMSNLLPPDEKYEGIVIRSDRINRFELRGNILTAECGVGLVRISSFLCKAGLSGFEGLSGIPGSLGGAVMVNAGAFGCEISDCISRVLVYDLGSDSVYYMVTDECAFSYRSSVFKSGRYVILSCEFKLREADTFSVSLEMERCREARIRTQPVGVPSLGSTFKRPGEKIYAAKLIDECGLKGYKIGGSQISSKHAGFIVNSGGATSLDYRRLMNYAQKCVYKKFGVYLESEIEIM